MKMDSLSLQNSVDYLTLSSHNEEETESQSGGNGTKMVLPLNVVLNGPKCDENGFTLSSQQFVDYPTLSSHKKEETEVQNGGNGTKMVLPLNDTLNRLKLDEYGALSSQRFVDYRTPSSHKEEETESQRGGNGIPNWRKLYEDGATFKRSTKLIHYTPKFCYLSSQQFVDYPTLSSHKEEETEAQSGRNGTKMVLPLNDTLNGSKGDENGALSLHNSLWTIRLFHRTKRRKRKPKVEETVRRWCYL